MKKELLCNDRRCQGKINSGKLIKIPVLRSKCPELTNYGYPCFVCGLLHSEEMNNFFQKGSDKMVYLKEDELVFG